MPTTVTTTTTTVRRRRAKPRVRLVRRVRKLTVKKAVVGTRAPRRRVVRVTRTSS